jgi:aspartate aminotransferase
MPSLSSVSLGLERSGIRRLMSLAAGMEKVIRLEIGEPTFPTPEHIVQAGCQALQAGHTKYTPAGGTLALRRKISASTSEFYARAVPPERVAVCVGAVGALSSAILALVEPGEQVLLPDPGWPNYRSMCQVAGAEIVTYSLAPEDAFLPSIAVLERLVTPRTKLLLINSPSNPLGTVFPAELMRDLVAFAQKHDLFLLSDEVYERMVFEGETASAYSCDVDDRVIVASSFSKTYSMTGWRIGYAIAPETIILQMQKLQESSVSCVSAVSQKAAEAALAGPQDCVTVMREAYREHRALATAALDSLRIPYFNPRGAFYLWVDVGSSDSNSFAEHFLQEKQVSVAPGATFGPSGARYIRVSLASKSSDIHSGLLRLADFLKH